MAKYASKGTEQIGGIPVRIRAIPTSTTGKSRLTSGNSSPPAGSSATAANTSRCDSPGGHQLGYGGHFSTRTRRYSVTLTSRRRERQQTRTAWIRQQQGLPAAPGVITPEWHYAGTG